MDSRRHTQLGLPVWIFVALACTTLQWSSARLIADQAATNSVTAQPAGSVPAARSGGQSKPPAPKVRRQLSGAELYSIHCNRCHPERYPTERTAAQWKTILLHMRVRANLPAAQARTILQYLQDNSGR